MLVFVQDWFKAGSRPPPGCAAFDCSIVTKHDEEDNGVDHPDWCDEEVREQLGFGFWAQAAGQGRNGGEEVGARRKEEIDPGKRQVVGNSQASAADGRTLHVKIHLRYCAA